jgi:hypothetical protein
MRWCSVYCGPGLSISAAPNRRDAYPPNHGFSAVPANQPPRPTSKPACRPSCWPKRSFPSTHDVYTGRTSVSAFVVPDKTTDLIVMRPNSAEQPVDDRIGSQPADVACFTTGPSREPTPLVGANPTTNIKGGDPIPWPLPP